MEGTLMNPDQMPINSQRDEPKEDLITEHLETALRHATLAYNVAENANKGKDTQCGLALVVAKINQQLDGYRCS